MHDWVHASEYYNKFFSWRLDFKVNDYLNFFSTTNFSYQYLPEAKAYLETSRTSTMELANFFSKFTRKHLCRSLFLIKLQTGFYPQCSPVNLLHISEQFFLRKGLLLYSSTSLKETTPTEVFSDEFCEVLKTSFLQNTSRQLSLLYGKMFYQ